MAEQESLILVEGQGFGVRDIGDGVSSLCCNVNGHRHLRLDAGVREELGRVVHVTNLSSSIPTTIKLARRLAEIAPLGVEHVFLCHDGATAVEVALKGPSQYWRQRPDPRLEKAFYLALGDAYHRDTLGGVSVGGAKRFGAMFAPLLFVCLRVSASDTHRTPPGIAIEGPGLLEHYLGCAYITRPGVTLPSAWHFLS